LQKRPIKESRPILVRSLQVVATCTHAHTHTHAHTLIHTHTHTHTRTLSSHPTRWYAHIWGEFWLVGSIKLWVSFAKKPYKRDNILQKRPIIVSILLTEATPISGHIPNLYISSSYICKCIHVLHLMPAHAYILCS